MEKETNFCILIEMIRMNLSHIMRNIFSMLPLRSLLDLSTTCTEIRDYATEESEVLKTIRWSERFNFDCLPGLIGTEEIEMIHRIFPNLKHLKTDLTFSDNGILDEMKVFKKLEKISLYLYESNYENLSQQKFCLKKLTVRQNYYKHGHDAVYEILTHIKELQEFTIYNGMITSQSADLLRKFKLRKLKLHNVDAETFAAFKIIHHILNNDELENLRLTSEKYILFPQFIRMNNEIIDLMHIHSINLTKLAFTVDKINKNVKYENLWHLKKLKELKIYFSVQTLPLQNLDKLIEVTSRLQHVDITFIEFFETPQISTQNILERTVALSDKYAKMILGHENLKLKKLNIKGTKSVLNI